MRGGYVLSDRQVEMCELPKPEPGFGAVLVKAIEAGLEAVVS